MKHEVYRRLQQHLDTHPVGFAASEDDSDVRLLAKIFTPEQAELACRIGWHHESTREIYAKATDLVASEDELSRKLHEVLENGGVSFRRRGDEEWWAIVPLVLGMYEYQVGRLSPRLLLALRDYWQSPKTGERRDGSAGEPREEPPGQMRVIPIGASVTPDLTVGTFDEISHLVDAAGDRIALLPCVCRRHHAMLGQACERTAREESCMAFLDWADHAVEQGVGRPISREEALEALAASQREGLVLMPSNSKEAQFVCSCCPDCCGVLTGLRRSERPADRARSSYRAVVDGEACIACGSCEEMCPLDAIHVEAGSAVVDYDRCIGCGVCVARCAPGAVSLERRPHTVEPPDTMDDLYELYDTMR